MDVQLCLTCCVAAKLDGVTEDSEEFSQISCAVTLVSEWMQTVIGGQVVMACVMVPVCWTHLIVTPKTAIENGRLVTG